MSTSHSLPLVSDEATEPLVPGAGGAAESDNGVDGDNCPKERMFRGTLPAERQSQRRKKLLDAGIELFSSIGYQRTTITMICRTAGVSPKKFYESFSGTEDVMLQIFQERSGNHMRRVLTTLLEAPPNFEDRLRFGLSAYCHSVLDDPRFARVLLAEAVGLNPLLEDMRRTTLRKYAELLYGQFLQIAEANGSSIPPFDSARARFLTIGLIGASSETIMDFVRDPEPAPIEDLVDSLYEMYLAVARSVLFGESSEPLEFPSSQSAGLRTETLNRFVRSLYPMPLDEIVESVTAIYRSVECESVDVTPPDPAERSPGR